MTAAGFSQWSDKRATDAGPSWPMHPSEDAADKAYKHAELPSKMKSPSKGGLSAAFQAAAASFKEAAPDKQHAGGLGALHLLQPWRGPKPAAAPGSLCRWHI